MNQKHDFNFVMISAMYENGGNTTQRMLDGHPELYVYPFESQLGTRKCNNFVQSLVPFRYCWPEFEMNSDTTAHYEAFYDEELKTLTRVPHRSKFNQADFKFDEEKRKKLFKEHLKDKPENRANIVEAFFKSTFESWENLNKTGKEKFYVGYSPVIALETEKILKDFPDAHILHVVRNPYSGYADTKKRPFPLSLKKYVWTWNITQHMALTFAEQYPKNFHLVRYEDLVANPEETMKKVSDDIGISFSETMLYPSFNAVKLEKVYPWGTIKTPTPEINVATMNELTADEKAEIRITSSVMLKQLGYEDFAS